MLRKIFRIWPSFPWLLFDENLKLQYTSKLFFDGKCGKWSLAGARLDLLTNVLVLKFIFKFSSTLSMTTAAIPTENRYFAIHGCWTLSGLLFPF
jgi:hypothetical protein